MNSYDGYGYGYWCMGWDELDISTWVAFLDPFRRWYLVWMMALKSYTQHFHLVEQRWEVTKSDGSIAGWTGSNYMALFNQHGYVWWMDAIECSDDWNVALVTLSVVSRRDVLHHMDRAEDDDGFLKQPRLSHWSYNGTRYLCDSRILFTFGNVLPPTAFMRAFSLRTRYPIHYYSTTAWYLFSPYFYAWVLLTLDLDPYAISPFTFQLFFNRDVHTTRTYTHLKHHTLTRVATIHV